MARRELQTTGDSEVCAVCARTLLKGERAERYLTQVGEEKRVCDLCVERVRAEGWIRESVAGDLPAMRPGGEPRPTLWGRLRRRSGEAPEAEAVPDDLASGPDGQDPSTAGVPSANGVAADPPPAELGEEHDPPEETARPARARDRVRQRARQAERGLADQVTRSTRRRQSRQVRAVPMTEDAKVSWALELFNRSGQPRTIAGIARSLGDPWVSAAAVPGSSAEVTVVVAWELSWYRYRVDLSDGDQPVTLLQKGEDLRELGDSLGDWNATADAEGRLAVSEGPAA